MENLWGLVGKKVELSTKAGDIYKGTLAGILGNYVHIILKNDSGVWLSKDSIEQGKDKGATDG